MKRQIFVYFSILILIISGMNTTSLQVVDGEVNPLVNSPERKLRIEQTEFSDGGYQPILVSVTSQNNDDIRVIRERNDTLGEGAIYQATAYTNITFNYAVALSNETTFNEEEVDFRLLANLPIVNNTNFNNTATNAPLSFTDTDNTIELVYTNTNQTNLINYTLPYEDTSIIQNATLYYFQTTVEVNVSSGYIPFFVRDATDSVLSEIRDKRAYNLITSQTYFNTSSEDEFYVQNELVNITGSVFFADDNVDGFGIVYRLNSSAVDRFANFTMIFNGNNSDKISLKSYNPDTIISWRSIFYANDTLINQTRTIERIDSKVTTVGDGRPTIDIDLVSDHPSALRDDNLLYSQNFTVTFTVIGNVPKGNITNITLIPDTGLNPIQFQRVNDSYEKTELTLVVDFLDVLDDQTAMVGNFSVTIAATTDKDLKTEDSFEVIIDQNNPTASLDSSFIPEDGIVVTTDGEVTFNFTAADDHSGIRVMWLDLGDDTSAEVTGMESYTHKYRNFNSSFTVVGLTVLDFAGNEAFSSISFTLQQEELGRTRPPVFGYVLFFATVIALISSYYWAPWLNEKLRG